MMYRCDLRLDHRMGFGLGNRGRRWMSGRAGTTLKSRSGGQFDDSRLDRLEFLGWCGSLFEDQGESRQHQSPEYDRERPDPGEAPPWLVKKWRCTSFVHSRFTAIRKCS